MPIRNDNRKIKINWHRYAIVKSANATIGFCVGTILMGCLTDCDMVPVAWLDRCRSCIGAQVCYCPTSRLSSKILFLSTTCCDASGKCTVTIVSNFQKPASSMVPDYLNLPFKKSASSAVPCHLSLAFKNQPAQQYQDVQAYLSKRVLAQR